MLVLFEPARQVFLVHPEALDATVQCVPVFVDPARPSEALAAPPPSVLTAIHLVQAAARASQRSVLLRSDASHARVYGVALAGWLLGYPVVYAVTQAPIAFTALSPSQCDGRVWDADTWPTESGKADNLSLLLVQAMVHVTLPGVPNPCVYAAHLVIL